MSDVKTDELVSKWESARKRVEDANAELNRSKCILDDVTLEMAKWLTPSDAKPDEVFSIWHYGKLLNVKYDPINGAAKISVRPGEAKRVEY